MIHPSTEIKFVSKEKGIGVFATQFIPKGTITWVQDEMDLVFSPSKVHKLGELYAGIIDNYTFRDGHGNFILCWDHGKYVNHSFNSNCITTPYNFEIAIRDIEVGEELTDDYGYLNISKPFIGIDEDSSRKVVYPDDLLNFHQLWDDQIAQSIVNFNKVDQPLMNYLDNSILTKIDRVLQGIDNMDSIISCYYDQK